VDLRLESQWVNIADVALDPNNLTDLRPGFMVGMVVRNPGMPTVIDWRAEVTWPDQQKETIYPEVRSNTTIHTDKGDTTFNTSDLLTRRTAVPIVHGGMVNGVLVFIFKEEGGYTRQDLLASRIVVIARDVKRDDHAIKVK